MATSVSHGKANAEMCNKIVCQSLDLDLAGSSMGQQARRSGGHGNLGV